MKKLKSLQRVAREKFGKRVDELRRDSHFIYEDQTEAHEFGYKYIRDNEAHTITDWGNIGKFLDTQIKLAYEAGRNSLDGVDGRTRMNGTYE